MIPAFPKIFALGSKQTQDIFQNEVEITEKIDGSQIAFGKINGELFIRSKGRQIFQETCDDMFKAGVNYILSIKDKLPEGYTFYGEYLKSNKHNVLVYDRIPNNHIMIYGVSRPDGSWLRYREIQFFAARLRLETVPVLYQGEINSVEELKSNLDRTSILGKAKIEGFVVKNYSKELLIVGQVIPLLMGKYVSDEFKEIHQKDWKKENTGKGKWEVYKSQFATTARWAKACQHLRDKGAISNTPRDIGILLKEINQDIEEEEKENIKEWLWNEFGREVLREAGKGFPQWYKEQLLNNIESK